MNGQQLKNSILQMAVQGKLVPQGPNDEPASVLLEKIRKEKEQLVKEGKIKKEKNPSYIFRGPDNLPYEKVGNNEPVCIADEVPFEIPDSWEWVRLGNVYNIEMGQSPAGNTVSSNKNGVEFHQGKVNFGEMVLQESGQYTSEPKKIAEQNSVLLCVRAPVGKVNITNRKVCIGRGLCAISPFADMSIMFLYHLLEAYENVFVKQATGTTFIAITAETIKNQLIPLPPLEEQKRIADKICELYTPTKKYAEIEAITKTLHTKFKEHLKKSILQEAIQGKLVPQDPKDEPASVLLERIRAEKQKLIKEGKIKKDKHESVIFRRDNSYYEKLDGVERCINNELPFKIPESWGWTKIESISIPVGSKANQVLVKEILDHGRIPVVSQGRELIDGYCNDESKKISTLPLVMFGDHTRNVKYIDFEFVIGADGTKFHKVIICSAMYIYYWMLYASETLRNRGYARHYSLLKKCYIPLPPLNEQIRIVKKLKEISSYIE